MALPLLTAELPGVDGHPVEPEDFIVEEIPAYLPCGEGEHTYALIEKRELTTRQAIDRLCRALSLPLGAAGYAGMKDKHAVTRQWISLSGAAPAQLTALPPTDDLRVLEVSRHRNKLKTGHLRGNRFTIRLRELSVGGDEALARCRAILDRLAAEGLPNFYGPQRFGVAGDNAERALAALRGEGKLPRDRHSRRLLISSAQSAIFNAALADRVERRELGTLLGGEVLGRSDSGGLFVSEDRQTDQARLDRREVVVTGPICGPRMPRPLEGSAAAALENEALGRFDVAPDDFGRFGRLARGGRRPLTVPVAEASVEMIGSFGADQPALALRFSLPAGSYATVLLGELAAR